MRLTANRLMVPGGNAFEEYILNNISPWYYWKLNESAGALNGTAATDYGTVAQNMTYTATDEARLTDITISNGPRGVGKRFNDNGSTYSYAEVSSAGLLGAGAEQVSVGFLMRAQTFSTAWWPVSLLSAAPVTNRIAQAFVSIGTSDSTNFGVIIRSGGTDRTFSTTSTTIMPTRNTSSAWNLVTFTYDWATAVGDETDLKLYINGSQATLNAISYTPAATAGLAVGHINVLRGNVSPEGCPQQDIDIAHVWVRGSGSVVTLAEHQAMNTLLAGAT